MAHSKNGAETLFKRLDVQLFEALEEQYFLPPRFASEILQSLDGEIPRSERCSFFPSQGI